MSARYIVMGAGEVGFHLARHLSPDRHTFKILGWLVLTLAFVGASFADELPRGEVIDPVPTLHEPNETFALYLPSSYSPERQWPIVFVLDPRSRGRMAAELFEEGAERFGYILISSNSTRSDSLPGEDPNPKAMMALLRDAMTRFAADEERIYLAGFSGTARYAWGVGFGIRGQVAGIIGCGGALPGPLEKWADVTFDFFGAAGETDFNHREMRFLDDALDDTTIVHRLEFFPGGHQWAPPRVLSEALAWFEILAIKAGTRDRDEALIAQLHNAAADDARELEAQGDLYGAFRRWDQLATDFTGLVNVSAARRNAQRLGALRQVKDDGTAIRTAVDREIAYRQKLDAVMARLEIQQPLPPVPAVVALLQIPRLLKQARGDSIAAQSAQRQLESAFVQTAFYKPRQFLRAGDTERALLSLKVATAVKPDHWRPWYALATAYAGAGRPSRAIDALERAVEVGYDDLAYIERDAELDPIREEKGYRRIVEALRGQQPRKD